MAPGGKALSCDEYHVAWICPVADIELLPARLMLDIEYPNPSYNTHYDENTYICGAINNHKVVIATCPPGETGNVNCGRLTGSMFKTFPNIRMTVLVGIGGGIPRSNISVDPLANLRLGDVVIGCPGDGLPACVYYERGKSKAAGHFEIVGTIKEADWRLRQALSLVVSDHEMGYTAFDNQLARLKRFKNRFAHPGLEQDKLFGATHHHVGNYGSSCTECDSNKLVQRPQRTEDHKYKLVFHQGRIATGNSVIQDAELRDKIGAQCNGALCVEMEAAGVDANRQCLVIRGVSDYADSHKNDTWKFYAAGNAAAFTRELLLRCEAPALSETFKANGNVSGIPQYSEASSSKTIPTNKASVLQAPSNNGANIVKVPKSSKEWSSAEDKKLLEVVQAMGTPKWKLVALNFHRNDWACQNRYEKLVQRRRIK